MRRATWLVAVVLSLAALALARGAEETRPAPKPPYEGEVIAQRVNVRAGGGTNYAILAVAERGELLRVKAQRFAWLAVDVPESCTLWVHHSLLSPQPDGKTATVAKDRVNIRARPRRRADIVGQLPSGARVMLVDRDGEWAGIAPPPQATAWIHGKFVRLTGRASPKVRAKSGRRRALDTDDAVALLRQARERYRAEIAKAPKERDFGDVLAAYQRVAAKCGEPALARGAERARQRLLKIIDLHRALQSAREPIEQFERQFGPLEAAFDQATRPGESRPR